MATPPPLQHLQYGVLALGDRSYGHFCGFGHQLDQWLRQHGAHPLFDAIEVDNADPAALRHWQQLLGQLGGGATELPDWSPAEYQPWTLLQREHLNPAAPAAPCTGCACSPAWRRCAVAGRRHRRDRPATPPQRARLARCTGLQCRHRAG
jgi:sulfite reductase alpha subunit-like flavoprotein